VALGRSRKWHLVSKVDRHEVVEWAHTISTSVVDLRKSNYLGRGFTFDDCEECTAISEDVHRVFFHEFINVGSTTLFDRYVITPKRTCAWKFVRSSYIGGDISYQNYLEETVPLNKMTSFLL
jgi:hypothetical protein